HGDATMQLDRLLGDSAGSTVDDELGSSELGRTLVVVFVIGQAGSQDSHGGGALQLADHIDHAVLQNLELADRLAELLARLQVIRGQSTGGAHGADRFATQSSDGAAALIADGIIGIAGITQQLALNVVQEQLATLAAIDSGIDATSN